MDALQRVELTVMVLSTMLLHSVQAVPHVAYACASNRLAVTCAPDEVINVVYANYGRHGLYECNQHGLKQANVTNLWDLSCDSPSAGYVINQQCNGKQFCKLQSSTLVFGDPCPNTDKYVELQYYCNVTTGCGGYQCTDGTCVAASARCDGIPDCADFTDEIGCLSALCVEGQFRCDDGQCVNGRPQCDGIRHCIDGSDESQALCVVGK